MLPKTHIKLISQRAKGTLFQGAQWDFAKELEVSGCKLQDVVTAKLPECSIAIVDADNLLVVTDWFGSETPEMEILYSQLRATLISLSSDYTEHYRRLYAKSSESI